MSLRQKRALYVAGIIERHNNDLLIVLAHGPESVSRSWQFPRGRARVNELPEAAMRRVAKEQLGLYVEIIVGQPPIPARIEGEKAEVRFFFCGITEGEPSGAHYAELAWIHKAHLREYEFDAISKPVVDWLLETRA